MLSMKELFKSANISVKSRHVFWDTVYVSAARKVIFGSENKIKSPSEVLWCFAVAIN